MKREFFLKNGLLQTKALGRSAVFYNSIDSTNLEAKRRAAQGCPHGQLVVSEHQTAGRGRRGRAWSDEAGASICMSVVLRPPTPIALAPRYTLAAAFGLHAALLSLGVDTEIKWPNDLLGGGKKLSGILLEAGVAGTGHFLVAGIGVNVNQTFFGGEIEATATSMRLLAGHAFEREEVLCAALNALEPAFLLCETDEGFAQLLERYGTASCTLGKKVDIIEADGTFSGVASALDALGRLLVRTEDGGLVTVNAGEVSLRPSKGQEA